MRIIRSHELPAVVLVKGRGVSAVGIPASLPSREVLELASLILSGNEYEELQRAVGSADDDAHRPGRGTAMPPEFRRLPAAR